MAHVFRSVKRNSSVDGYTEASARIRVLYSFPMKLGGIRACTTAWQQVKGIAGAGADVLVFPGAMHTALPPDIKVFPTLARGRIRIPYRLLGRLKSYALHDYIVSRRLLDLAGKIDVVHVWPLGALRTLQVAKQLGIITVYERPNAHTGFFYDTVENESKKLGIELPESHEHGYNAAVLEIEEREYDLAHRILCPSDFVAQSFLARGFSPNKLLRHHYGFDEAIYQVKTSSRSRQEGLRALFVGTGSPVKGLHYALDAWLQSSAHEIGTLTIVGSMTEIYAEKLAPMLAHPSVKVLGFRQDIPELMQQSDVLILPSVAEGSALVTYEARGSGCVLLVSDASGAICTHYQDALIHRAGDVNTLKRHITMLHEDRGLLAKLRTASLSTASKITWTMAGRRLVEAYTEAISPMNPISAVTTCS
jgi:glycosyltransferase involved in cell wall biosynthesis